MLKVSLVIFDMDGLMFDTEKIAISAWEKAGKTFGVNITPSVVIKTIGLDIEGTKNVFLNNFGEDFPYYKALKLRIKYASEYIKHNGMPVKKGLFELLEFLDSNNFKKAVATSTERKRAESYLCAAGVKEKFDLIVCGDEIEKGKPEPDIFKAAAESLDCKSLECIVLEDSENGILAASKAGMLPVFIQDIKRPAKDIEKLIYKEFNSLLDVKTFLQNY